MLAGTKIAIEVPVMRFAVRCRHQDFDIAADHLGALKAEQPLRRRAEGLDHPLRIGDDNRIGDRVEDRAQPQLAFAPGELGCLAVGDITDDADKN